MTDEAKIEPTTPDKEIAGLRSMLDGMHERNRELVRQIHRFMKECGFIPATEESEGGVPCLRCWSVRTPGNACGASGCPGQTLLIDAADIRDHRNEMIGRLTAAVDRIEELREELGVALRERDEARAIAAQKEVGR